MKIDGRRLHLVEASSGSFVSEDTVLSLRRRGATIEGNYAGGVIVAGFLVGFIIDNDPSQFSFRYVQADNNGNLDSGLSTAFLEELEDGRLRMIERYHWVTRNGSGVNVFEEKIAPRSTDEK